MKRFLPVFFHAALAGFGAMIDAWATVVFCSIMAFYFTMTGTAAAAHASGDAPRE